MRTLALVLAFSALVVGPVAAQGAKGPVALVGKVEYEPIDEQSGIARSRTYDDVWWVHNDSGNEPMLYAVNGQGELLCPSWDKDRYHGLDILLSANVDWEDIAVSEGKIYIAEMGNNGNARRDLGVYVVNEPNPRAISKTRPLRFIPIRYPDQAVYPAAKWHFDCEAMFVSGRKLYFITKHRVAGKISQGEKGAKLYRLDTERTDEENVLTLVDSNDDIALVTAADLSPDGGKLAVLTPMALWVFEEPKGDEWLSAKRRGIPLLLIKTKQAEGVCWDDDETIRISNEQRELFTVKLESLTPVKED